jgi:hypothetical protein
MHAIVYDKWETYGHESDPNGADFQYLLSGPSAHAKHDNGSVKFRRRRYELGVDRMVTTHGKQWDVPEYILDDPDELHTFLDQFSTGFMNNYTVYTLHWGNYRW